MFALLALVDLVLGRITENRPESNAIAAGAPRSDSGRLIRSIAIFTSNGTAASVPTETSAIAVAWRAGRFNRSATSIPNPKTKSSARQRQKSVQRESLSRFWNG